VWTGLASWAWRLGESSSGNGGTPIPLPVSGSENDFEETALVAMQLALSWDMAFRKWRKGAVDRTPYEAKSFDSGATQG
jgi:hypothetical protein